MAIVPDRHSLTQSRPSKHGISHYVCSTLRLIMLDKGMLGIVTPDDCEADMDGEIGRTAANTKRNTRSPKPSPPNPQPSAKANPKASPQPPRASQAPPHAHDFTQKSNGPNSSQIPQLHGVIYDSVEGHDSAGNSCEVITATGNTIPHKDQLVSAGFRWNAAKKVWWRYAETVQPF